MSDMPEFHSFNDYGQATPTWRLHVSVRNWLAALAIGLGILWRGSLGIWFVGIGSWWLWADPVSLVYAFVTGLQMGMACPAHSLGVSARGWEALAYVHFVPTVVRALPAEVLLFGGLLLIVSAVRRIVQ